jgi:hypothetical protein
MRLLERLPAGIPGPRATSFSDRPFDIPFPVHADSQPKADLAKLGGGPILIEDQAWPDWIAAKRAGVLEGRAPLLAPTVGEADLARWATAIRKVLSEQILNGPVTQTGAFPWLGGLCPDNPVEFFQALTLSLQEDFAVMAPDPTSGGIAAVLSVCFPSGWDPAEKLGQSLTAIHGPVADNAALQRATPSMAQAMLTKGPFVRFVWTLAGDDRLSRRPNEDTLYRATSVNDLWFRCERQVTVPLSGSGCLFLIRVFVAPYQQVVNTPERRQRMLKALQAMSPDMIRYKNIARAIELILNSPDV